MKTQSDIKLLCLLFYLTCFSQTRLNCDVAFRRRIHLHKILLPHAYLNNDKVRDDFSLVFNQF